MIEPEIAFADLADNATLAEALLKHTSGRCSTSVGTTWRSSTSGSRRA